MKKHSFLIVILTLSLFTLFLTIHPVFAEPTLDPMYQIIEDIISKTGIQAQLTTIPAQFDESWRKSKNEVKQVSQLEAIIKNDLAAEDFLADIKQNLADQYNEKLAGEVLRFYDSDLGVKMVRCELDAAADPAFNE
jgi:hypothetical protein